MTSDFHLDIDEQQERIENSFSIEEVVEKLESKMNSYLLQKFIGILNRLATQRPAIGRMSATGE